MCGITAIIGNDKNLSENINKMTSVLQHRGPDFYQTITLKKNIAFGHTRLKIIDLDNRSNQPMERNGIHIVYNGEIYNYLEIKKEINDFEFKTSSDTEIIIAAYLKWGDKCVEKFSGMFAFILWDSRKKIFFCSRDRLGIKPLYFFKSKNAIYLASEIKSILQISKGTINEKIIYLYLKHKIYEFEGETFFKNIYELRAGENLYIKNGTIKKKKYWDLFDVIKKNESNGLISNNKQVYEELNQNLDYISKIYLRSDVKNGIHLSSGIDSNFLYNLFSVEKNKKINSILTWAYKSLNKQDSDFLRKDFKRKEIHKFVYINHKDFWNNLEDIQYTQEMPFGGLGPFFRMALDKCAKKENVKVVLEGQGADELFGGYKKYLFPLLKKGLKNEFYDLKGNSTHYDMSNYGVSLISEKFNSKFKYLDDEIKLELPSKNDFTNHRYLDIKFMRIPRNMRFNDRSSMKYGVEMRVPFFEHKFVEFAFNIKPELHYQKNTLKYFLRTLKMPGYQEFKKREKLYLQTPQTEWFKKFYKEKIYKIFKDNVLYKLSYIDKSKAQKYCHNFFKEKFSENSFGIWQIINLDVWIKKFKIS